MNDAELKALNDSLSRFGFRAVLPTTARRCPKGSKGRGGAATPDGREGTSGGGQSREEKEKEKEKEKTNQGGVETRKEVSSASDLKDYGVESRDAQAEAEATAAAAMAGFDPTEEVITPVNPNVAFNAAFPQPPQPGQPGYNPLAQFPNFTLPGQLPLPGQPYPIGGPHDLALQMAHQQAAAQYPPGYPGHPLPGQPMPNAPGQPPLPGQPPVSAITGQPLQQQQWNPTTQQFELLGNSVQSAQSPAPATGSTPTVATPAEQLQTDPCSGLRKKALKRCRKRQRRGG